MHACTALVARLSAEPANWPAGACILQLLDCAQACDIAIGHIGRDSAEQDDVCANCAEVCEDSADYLENTGQSDPCVELCRACAATCFQLWCSANGVTLEKSPDAWPSREQSPALVPAAEQR
jgi:hypothetical protein